VLTIMSACSKREGTAVKSTLPYVALDRGAHPLALPEHDVGRLEGAKVLPAMALVFRPSPEQKAERDRLLDEIQRPGSPSYHKWLTPEEYANRFGASADDLQRAGNWLASQGLTVNAPSRLGARLTFTGTVAQVEAAFRTEMHEYRVGGESHYAMNHPPSLPADFAERILAVHNTHDFFPRRAASPSRLAPQATCPTGDTFCSGNGIAPPDWAFLYDVTPLYNTGIGGTRINGTGASIAVVGIADIAQADITAFRTRYGFASNPIIKTPVPNTGVAQGDNGGGIEGVLGVEWVGAIAPSAQINYVFTGAGDLNANDALFYAIEQNLGGVLLDSWAGCELGYTTADADVLQFYGAAASLEGITLVSPAGDSGAASCFGKGGLWVDLPAALPEVTAVGGTGFAIPAGLTFTGGTVTARGTEAAWNEAHNAYTGTIASGGGGISSVFARPAYQQSIPTCAPVGTLPSSVNPQNQRQIPDVSFTAGSGATQYGNFIACTLDAANGDCTNTGSNPQVLSVGGTSAAAAAFAGVVALADQVTGGRLGNINPLLYTASATTPTAFHDITTGNNEVVCRTGDPGCPGNNLVYGFAAATGYDCATGLGSIDARNLLTAWAGLSPTTTTLAATPTTTTEGAPVSLTATIHVPSPNTQSLSGKVTFYFQSSLANGAPDLSWSLGQAPIIGGTTAVGTAVMTAAIPPGMVQPNAVVGVYAAFEGGPFHLPSSSAKVPISFGGLNFAVSPPSASVSSGQAIAYASSGGIPPVRWSIDFDSTCSTSGTACSGLNPGTGSFSAGTGAPGYVIVRAIDSGGAEAFSEVTVAGGTGTPPWSASGPERYGIRASAPPPPPAVPAARGLTPLLAALLGVAGVRFAKRGPRTKVDGPARIRERSNG
jgi:subtilase family serine protease